MKYQFFFLAVGLVSSCASITNLDESQLESGYYSFHQAGSDFSKVYIGIKEDSVTIVPIDKNGTDLVPVKTAHNQVFQKHSFDIDVLAIPFKYRPSSYNFPRQLTADFNGNVFLGYRIDRYKTNFIQTPAGLVKKLRHRAFTGGVFGGFGGTFISPWTTDFRTTDEYNGLILSRGISAMVGIKSLTVGVGVGWDYLTDRDKDIWIYQNKPWYGLTLSLNLN